MAIRRKGEAVWTGDLRTGGGQISSESGVIRDTPYSFATRFEDEPGTNPEELIAAAHAGCYSMALANTLANKGYRPEGIETHATCILTHQDAGFAITKMRLEVRGHVPGIDPKIFKQIAEEADGQCPVSNLLRPGLEIELEANLA